MPNASDNEPTEQSIDEHWVDKHWDKVPGYLNTATCGLPTRSALSSYSDRLDQWRSGELAPASFDDDVDRCRRAYGDLVGTTEASVAVISQTSVATGLVAGSLEAGSTVLVADGDFTSVLFPFVAIAGLRVRSVPLQDLIDEIDAEVDLVAVSAAQSSDGTRLDLDRLHDVCRSFGVKTYVDLTQAAGWVEVGADRFDVTACHAYKWLCAPRGAAFMTIGQDALSWLQPRNAGWYAGGGVWSSIYGLPLRLATNARRFDVSPAWFAFAAAAPTLEALASQGATAIGAHSIALANRFRSALGLAPSDSAIVAIDTPTNALHDQGIAFAGRAGRARFSFYVYNTGGEADHVASLCKASAS